MSNAKFLHASVSDYQLHNDRFFDIECLVGLCEPDEFTKKNYEVKDSFTGGKELCLDVLINLHAHANNEGNIGDRYDYKVRFCPYHVTVAVIDNSLCIVKTESAYSNYPKIDDFGTFYTPNMTKKFRRSIIHRNMWNDRPNEFACISCAINKFLSVNEKTIRDLLAN